MSILIHTYGWEECVIASVGIASVITMVVLLVLFALRVQRTVNEHEERQQKLDKIYADHFRKMDELRKRYP